MPLSDETDLPSWLKPKSQPEPRLIQEDEAGGAPPVGAVLATEPEATSHSASKANKRRNPVPLEISSEAVLQDDDMAIPEISRGEIAPEQEPERINNVKPRGFLKRFAAVFQVIFIFLAMLVASLVAGFLFGYLGLGF